MTRDELAQAINDLIDRLTELGTPARGPGEIESYWQDAMRLLPAAYPSGHHAESLLDGETDTRPIVVPPHSAGDLLASLVVRLAAGATSGQVELVAVVSSSPATLCVRFESPERTNYEEGDLPEGVHDFHHAQQSSTSRIGIMPEAESLPGWYPDSAIAIPLPAHDALDLILCALLAVRHPEFVREMAATLTPALNERVSRLLGATGAMAS